MQRECAVLLVAALAVGCGDSATAPALSVSAIAPHSGQTAGGTAVTIYGTGFVSGATVTVAGTAAANVRWIGPSFLTATSPAHAAGAVDVVVTNPDGQTVSIANGFIYADLAGSWSGTTSQGKPISFTVSSSNGMSQLSYEFDNGCSGVGVVVGTSSTQGIDVSSSSFSSSSPSATVTGTFRSNSSASGTMTFSAPAGCVGNVTATWNANKN